MQRFLTRLRRGSADSPNKPSDAQQHSPLTPSANSTATTVNVSVASSPSLRNRLLPATSQPTGSPRTAASGTHVTTVSPLSLPPAHPSTTGPPFHSHSSSTSSASLITSPTSSASPPIGVRATASTSASSMTAPEPSPRRSSAPNVLDKAELLSPTAVSPPVGSFRYIYKDDQNRRRSFDTACLFAIRSSSPQPHTPTSPHPTGALSSQLSPWLLSYPTASAHMAVRSEEEKAEQASREEVDVELRRLVADRRQAMAFVRWLQGDDERRSMRLLMDLIKVVERGEELKDEECRQEEEDEKGERRKEERVKDFSSAVATVVGTHLQGGGKEERATNSKLPSLPAPLFRFLLSFTATLPASSSPSLLSPSPATSPVPSPYSLARRLLSPQQSSPSVSPLSTATASPMSSPLNHSPHSPTTSRRRLTLLLHLLTQCVYSLEQWLYESHYLTFRTVWQSSLEAATPQGQGGYTLRVCLESTTLYSLFIQWMGEERRHRLVTEWAAMYSAIHMAVDAINRVGESAAFTDERQTHEVALIGSSFSTPISSSLSARETYRLFVSLETPYRFLHPEEHASFLGSLPSHPSPPSSIDATRSELTSALASLLLLVIPACTKLDSSLSTTYFPAFCESSAFAQLPPYHTLLDMERHQRYSSPQHILSLRSHQLLDSSPVSLFSSSTPANKPDVLTSFVKSVYAVVDKQPDVHKVEEFIDLVPDGLVDDDDTALDQNMEPLTVSHATVLPDSLVGEKQLSSLPPSKRLESVASATAMEAARDCATVPRAVADLDAALPRPVLLSEAVVLNELQWKVEDDRHPFLDSVNILRRVTVVPSATAATSTCFSSIPAPLFDPLPSSLPELSYVTNEQALQAEQAVSAPDASSLLCMLGKADPSSSAASSRVEVHSCYPTSINDPTHLTSLCFPLPPETRSLRVITAAVDEFGFPSPDAAAAMEGVQLFPVYTADEQGSALYGYVLQMTATEEEEEEQSEQPTAVSTANSSGDSGGQCSVSRPTRSRDSSASTPAALTSGPPSPVNSSPSIALTRMDSSSFPSTPIELSMPDGPGSRLSSAFLANLQFVVTPPIEERTLSNGEVERKEQRVRFQFQQREGEDDSELDGGSGSGSGSSASKLDMEGRWVDEPRTQVSNRPSLLVSTDEDMALPSSAVKRILEVSPLIMRNRSSQQQLLEPPEDCDSSVKAVRMRRVLVQYAVCVLSRLPFHTQLRQLLLTLPTNASVLALTSSSAYRSLLVLTQPGAAPPCPSVPTTSSAVRAASLPALDFSLDALFSFLRPSLLLRLVESVILERRLVLASSSLGLLHLASRGVLALLYPLTWQHRCVPVLLPAQFSLLSSLPSCLLGIHSSHLPAAMAAVQRSGHATLVVDLDSDSVLLDDTDLATEVECDGIPPCIREALLLTMRRQYRAHGETDHGHVTSRSDNSEPTSHLLRVAFVKAWCQLLSSYRSFTLHSYHPTSPSVLFDRTAFLRHKPPALTPFLSVITASSAFLAFLSQRCTPLGLAPVDCTAFDRLESVLSGERLGWQQVERERLDESVRCVGRVGVARVGEASVVADESSLMKQGEQDG